MAAEGEVPSRRNVFVTVPSTIHERLIMDRFLLNCFLGLGRNVLLCIWCLSAAFVPAGRGEESMTPACEFLLHPETFKNNDITVRGKLTSHTHGITFESATSCGDSKDLGIFVNMDESVLEGIRRAGGFRQKGIPIRATLRGKVMLVKRRGRAAFIFEIDRVSNLED